MFFRLPHGCRLHVVEKENERRNSVKSRDEKYSSKLNNPNLTILFVQDSLKTYNDFNALIIFFNFKVKMSMVRVW